MIITSESVTKGHPDKLCDAVSDALLDAYLKQDPFSRVAVETCVSENYVLVVGEVTTEAKIDAEAVVRKTIKNIRYTSPEKGLDGDHCEANIRLHKQSRDIVLGVNQSFEGKSGNYEDIGAGDQGMMYGYATDETVELMPYPIVLAHKLTRRLDMLRESTVLPYLRPDGKSQVSIQYDHQGRPQRIDTIIVSCQHDEVVSKAQLEKDIHEKVINSVVPSHMIDPYTKIYINPTGRFVIGAPAGDSGLTGRKIIVDTYGGFAKHGGGAFSGKNPTKVDRSGAYMARYIAKNIVASHLAKKCEIQISYAIGLSHPISININTFGTSKISDELLCHIVKEVFDLRPAAIIDQLHLRSPIYQATSSYGHFGRLDQDFSWEKTDKVEPILLEAKQMSTQSELHSIQEGVKI